MLTILKTSLFVRSGVTYYAFERFSMSHVYEFFFIFLITLKYEEKNLSQSEFLIPLLHSFLLLRWSNYHLFLIPFFIFPYSIYLLKKAFYETLLYFCFLAGAVLFLIHTSYKPYTFNPSNIF